MDQQHGFPNSQEWLLFLSSIFLNIPKGLTLLLNQTDSALSLCYLVRIALSNWMLIEKKLKTSLDQYQLSWKLRCFGLKENVEAGLVNIFS